MIPRTVWCRHETSYDLASTRDFLWWYHVLCGADTRLLTMIPRTVWRRHETSYDDSAYCGADTRLLTILRRHDTSYDDTTYRVAQTRDFLRFYADTRLLTMIPRTVWRRHETLYEKYHHWYSVCFWRKSPQWRRASTFTRFLDHTQRRTTLGRSPLDEWSVRRRDLYLTTQQQTDINAPGEIRTHNLSRRSAAGLRLRPRGHWDRHLRSSSFR